MRPVRSGDPVGLLVVVASLAFLLLPLGIVVLFSFHSTASLSFPFEGFSLRWYEETFASADVRSAVRNSLVVAGASALLTLPLGTLAAYGLSRSSSRWRGPIAFLFFLPIMLPGLFVGLALLVFFGELRVTLSLLTVVIAHVLYVLPFFVLLARAALDRTDAGMEEAAADLGASRWGVFRRVTLPQVRPVLLAATALAFALSFDEFIITFFVVGPDSTIPLFIWGSLRRTTDPSINTVSSLLMLVTTVLSVAGLLLLLRADRNRRRQLRAGAPMQPVA
jgi:spermidine/putrescine transport system permease protein